MGLENYTTEELKAEISRRKSLAKMELKALCDANIVNIADNEQVFIKYVEKFK